MHRFCWCRYKQWCSNVDIPVFLERETVACMRKFDIGEDFSV